MNTSLTLLNRTLQLFRYPQNLQHVSWQAWDAADEYLIEYVEQNFVQYNELSIRIYNDDFGALGCWFAHAKPEWVSDSYVALTSFQQNLAANELSLDSQHLYDSISQSNKPLDLVLIKVPKTSALLEQQLIDLQKVVTPNTQIIATGKVNAIQKSTQALFDKYLGPCHTSLAKKKSRLIFCQATGQKTNISPYPTVWHIENPAFKISNLANVFARQQLDIGARFVLQNLHKLPPLANKTIIDLGCGNGVLGLHILHKNKSANVIFVDESYMAISSAKQNVLQNIPDQIQNCDFVVDNCLDDFQSKSNFKQVDLVICNPPFHQQNTITDHIAWQMFRDSYNLLNKDGHIYIVGNRHLDYPAKLKRLFGNVKIEVNNQKFSILSATKL